MDAQKRAPMLLAATYFTAQLSWMDNVTYPEEFDRAYFHTRTPNEFQDMVHGYADEFVNKVRLPFAFAA